MLCSPSWNLFREKWLFPTLLRLQTCQKEEKNHYERKRKLIITTFVIIFNEFSVMRFFNFIERKKFFLEPEKNKKAEKADAKGREKSINWNFTCLTKSILNKQRKESKAKKKTYSILVRVCLGFRNIGKRWVLYIEFHVILAFCQSHKPF